MAATLSEHHQQLYAFHLAGNRKLLALLQKLAGDPSKVVKAVDHALTSTHPRRRYLMDVTSRVQKRLLAMTPTAVKDAVLSAASTTRYR